MDIDEKHEELYRLYKLRAVKDVRDDVVAWAKSRIGFVVALLAVLGFFGAGGFVSMLVGDRINLEMTEVNKRILDTVKSAVQAEIDAKNASVDARKATEEAVIETKKVSAAAIKLRETIERIDKQASSLESRFERIQNRFSAQNENVRDEVRLLVESTRKRLDKLDAIIAKLAKESSIVSSEQVTKDVQELKDDIRKVEETFAQNSKYEIYLSFPGKSNPLAEHLDKYFRSKGFKVSKWPNIELRLEEYWGYKLEDISGNVSVVASPGMPKFGEIIASEIRNEGTVAVVHVLFDKTSWGDQRYAGILIPPNYTVPQGIRPLPDQ